MSYINDYIKRCPAFGWEGGPGFSTQIVDLANGRERRNAQWSRVRHKYSLPFQNIRPDAYMGIKQMHLTCRGRLHAFRFRDALDHMAIAEPFAVADGTRVTYQLLKQSVIDGVQYAREVFAVVDAQVFIDGVETAAAGDVRRGLVTFAVPPAAGAILTWSGTFDVWVRFDQDDLPFSIDNANAQGYFINGTVTLIEVPPPGPGE